MTIDQKNKYRLRIRVSFVVQWMFVTGSIVVGMFLEQNLPYTGELLTASTTALSTALGLDYFTAPTDNK